MKLKPDDQMQVALATEYTGLTEERKKEIIGSIRATKPGKLDELHAIFMLNPPQGLTAEERPFYEAIVELSGDEPGNLNVGMSDEEMAQQIERVDPTDPDALLRLEANCRSLLEVHEMRVQRAEEGLAAVRQKLSDISKLTGSLTSEATAAPAEAFAPGGAPRAKRTATNGTAASE